MEVLEISFTRDPNMTSGRPAGSKNKKKYKWIVKVVDPDGTVRSGKYSTRDEANEDLGLNLGSHIFWTIRHYKPDENDDGSRFLKKWGHIQIDSIEELRDEDLNALD
jgi:hypothetical protein